MYAKHCTVLKINPHLQTTIDTEIRELYNQIQTAFHKATRDAPPLNYSTTLNTRMQKLLRKKIDTEEPIRILVIPYTSFSIEKLTI